MFALRFLVIVSKSERDRYSLKCVEYIECVCVRVCLSRSPTVLAWHDPVAFFMPCRCRRFKMVCHLFEFWLTNCAALCSARGRHLARSRCSRCWRRCFWRRPRNVKAAFWCLPHQMWHQMDRENVAQFPSLWPYLNSNIVGCSDGWRRRMMAAWDDDDVDVCPTRRQSVTPAIRQGCTRPTTWGWPIK